MLLRRSLPMLGLGLMLMHAAPACVSDETLNPQPLPPATPAPGSDFGNEKDPDNRATGAAPSDEASDAGDVESDATTDGSVQDAHRDR